MQKTIQQNLQQVTQGPAQATQAATDQRINKIEATLTEVVAHGQKLEGWIRETGTRLGNTEQQLQTMSSALHQTQAELVTTRQEISTQADSMNKSVNQTMQNIGKELRAQFDTKVDSMTTRLEALMEKKMRTS